MAVARSKAVPLHLHLEGIRLLVTMQATRILAISLLKLAMVDLTLAATSRRPEQSQLLLLLRGQSSLGVSCSALLKWGIRERESTRRRCVGSLSLLYTHPSRAFARFALWLGLTAKLEASTSRILVFLSSGNCAQYITFFLLLLALTLSFLFLP